MRCSKCGLIYDDTYGSNTCSCGGEIVSDQDYCAIRNTVRVSKETERLVSAESARSNSKGKVNKKVIVLAVSIAVLAVALVSGVLLWQSSFAKIPIVTNQNREAAVQAIVAAGFDKEIVEITKDYNDEVKKGYVIQQNKMGWALRSSKITLTISCGPDLVSVPDMKEWSEKKVKSELIGKLKFKCGEPVYSSSIKEGLVVKQDITAGKKVHRNEVITIYLSKGPEIVTVPNFVGLKKDQAEKSLEKAGLKLGETIEEIVSDKSQDRTVVKQSIAGTADKGSKVDLTIGKYEAPTTIAPSITKTPSNISGPNVGGSPDSTTKGPEESEQDIWVEPPVDKTTENDSQQDNDSNTGWQETDGDWKED